MLLPVSTDFREHPLLRLRELDPELSPPEPVAHCGSAVAASRQRSATVALFNVARAQACREAGGRRILVAVAAGGLIFTVGLVGVAAARQPRDEAKP